MLYNDSQFGAFSRERAHATRGIYSCAEKALGYLMQSDLGTSTQLSARQVSSPHQVAYLGQARPVPGLRLSASVRAWPTPVSTCQHLDRAWATPGPRMGQQCQEILTLSYILTSSLVSSSSSLNISVDIIVDITSVYRNLNRSLSYLACL